MANSSKKYTNTLNLSAHKTEKYQQFIVSIIFLSELPTSQQIQYPYQNQQKQKPVIKPP